MENPRFCNSEISKITKTLIFHWYFAKNEILISSALDGQKKKIRDGSDDPKNEFKTLLWDHGMKKYDRLVKFEHF